MISVRVVREADSVAIKCIWKHNLSCWSGRKVKIKHKNEKENLL